MANLNGNIALVTGAGRGLGAAIARQLSANGAEVVLVDVDPAAAADVAKQMQAESGRASSFAMDVTDRAMVGDVVSQVEQAVGPIDILVNNAGISGSGSFLAIEEREWDRMMEVNAKGLFLVCQAVAPAMIKRRTGRIINIGSVLSKQGEAMLSHYAASKFAVLGFSQSLAAELAPHNVTVNTVCPGAIYTPLWNDLFNQAIERGDFTNSDEMKETVERTIPLQRPQSAEDIAAMVAFLASAVANNITGASFHVDGGYRPR